MYPIRVDKVPQILIYDKGCQLLRTIRAYGPDNPDNVSQLDKNLVVVDRFHHDNHAPHDDFCKDNCSPYHPGTLGMVRTISKVRVQDAGEDVELLTAKGKSILVNVAPAGAPVRMVKRRCMRLQERVINTSTLNPTLKSLT